jgi:hypothetical protein
LVIKTERSRAISRLVLDCEMYNLSHRQAVDYVHERLGDPDRKKVSVKTIQRYRKELRQGFLTTDWLNYYTKVGFVVEHAQLLEKAKDLQRIIDLMLSEELKKEFQDFRKIDRLFWHMREFMKLINDLKFGTPIIAQIKKSIEDYRAELDRKNQELWQLQHKEVIEDMKKID